jgi:hypothetical protein
MITHRSTAILHSKPFHTVEAVIDGITEGAVIGMTDDGASIGAFGTAFPVCYGIAISVVGSACLICDSGWVFDEWRLTDAQKRLLSNAGVVVE